MIDRSLIGFAALLWSASLTSLSNAANDPPLVIEAAPLASGSAISLSDAVAKANAAGRRAVEIRLAPGTYVLHEGLRFSSELASLSVTAAGSGVRFVGSLEAKAPAWEPLSGAHASRVPERARASVRQWRLDAESLKGWKGGLSGPVHSGQTVAVEADRSELFVGGRAFTLARWPDAGFASVGKLVDAGSVPRNQADDVPADKRSKEPDRGGSFIPGDKARTATWAAASDAWMHGYWNWDWSDELLPVASIDKEKGLVRLAKPHRYGLAARGRFAIVNLPEELDAPGEYWIDREHGLVCAVLAKGDETLTAQVSLLAEPMLSFAGSHDVVIRGVRFESSRAGAIVAVDARAMTVDSCEFVNLGAGAVSLAGRDCVVTRCRFTDVGGVGVSLSGGDRVTLTPGDDAVEDCVFTGCGRLQRTYHPAIRLDGVGNRVVRNEISRSPHIALMFSGNDHLIEGNEIHHVVLETGDAGAVYTGRDWTAQGTIIRGNFFHDIRGTDARYQNAVYLDDMASGLLVEHNLFADCNWGILAGGGRDLTLRDNVFLSCGKALSFDSRGTGWMAINIADPATSTLIRSFHAMPVSLEPWASRYPRLASYLVDEMGKPVRGKVADNHLVNTPLGSIEDRRNVEESGTTKETLDRASMAKRTAELATAVRHGEITVGAARLGPVGPRVSGDAAADAWRIDPEGAALSALRDASPRWTSPGLTPAGSMPVGNGRLGANAWVESSGDLVLLLSHTDSFSECERLLKLARVRIACDPPLDPSRDFTQQLDLEAGSIRIRAGDGEFEVLPDAETDVMLVRMKSATPRRLGAKLEVWRTATREISGNEQNSSWLMHAAPAGVSVAESADAVVDLPDALAWYHRNETSVVPFTLDHQGLTEVASEFPDPLLRRTFGGRIEGDGLAKVDATTLRAQKPATESVVRIVVACSQAESAKAWLQRLASLAADAPDWSLAAARTRAAWTDRWRRSFVFVEPAAMSAPLDNAHPLRVGVDSGGGNRFVGHIAGAIAFAKAASESELLELASGPVMVDASGACLESGDLRHAGSFTFVAWIRPERPGVTGRIIDKVTAGRGDGALLDLQNGRLRAVVGDVTVQTDAAPEPGVITCVALVHDGATGEPRLFVAGKPVQGRTPATRRSPVTVSQAYALQRYVVAAATKGEFPVKFNGSIFTVPPVHVNGATYDDDFRAWGGDYWWQNTRLPYHGMIARGDDDLLESLFSFYERVTPGCVSRAKSYYGADGVYFPETMTTFGTYANADYGWNRSGLKPSDVACAYWRYAWNQGPELVAMMLDRWDATRDRRDLERRTLPMAAQVLGYFESRFAKDASGRLVISPTQAIETYWTGVVNDLPTVAGLRDVSARLCELPADVGTRSQRALFSRMKAACPDLPMRREVEGPARFSPAEKFDPQRSNCENPELMAVWPFSLSGVGRGLLAEGRASYAARIEKMTHGWTQDGQQAARLGLAEQAASNLLAKVRNTHSNFRFPTFWGPNFDWLPDQCHGGNLLTTTQEMLLQSAGDRIIVCPALPRDWSGHFRLRASRNTTVTASLSDGVVEWLVVDPPERLRDVIPGEGWIIRGR